ncbi:MAG: hypothetical protein H0X51_00805 [Parachlamydiaceae bacterium]|nr:hypothetical protein [Parachlamydiaceae bacterium]
MKINNKVFSIPPYISTLWVHITALHMKENILIVNLNNGKVIEIPELPANLVETIFNMHAMVLEQPKPQSQVNPSSLSQAAAINPLLNRQHAETPFRFALGPMEMGADMGAIGASVLEHNAAQGDIPEIPEEILSKIVAITKLMAPQEMQDFPKAEAHCNCVHCQVSRAFNQETPERPSLPIAEIAEEEEKVSELDLHFQDWEITETGKQMFSVMNKLDNNEKYLVCLGDTIGCTCGQSNCEHIVAVLKS